MTSRDLDRYMWGVDLAIIALFATFLASGTSQILAGLVDVAVMRAVDQGSREPVAPVRSQPSSFEPVDGLDILRRNIFDSVTGPLDGTPDVSATLAEALPGGDEQGGIPPRCDGPLELKASYASADHPQYSFVAIQEGPETRILETGDTIAGYEVESITWRYTLLASPEKGRCYLDVWAPAPEAPAKGKKGKAKEKEKKNLDPNAFKALLGKSIEDVSATEKNVDRSLVLYLKESPKSMTGSGKMLPNVVGKKTDGFKLYGIRKASLWGKLGFQNGDVLLSVGGTALTSPEKAREALSGIGEKGTVDVQVQRHGKPLSLKWNIK